MIGAGKRDRLPQAVLREIWLRSGGFGQCGSACAGQAGGERGKPLAEDAWFAQPMLPVALGGVAVRGTYRAVCAAGDQVGAAQVESLLRLVHHVGLAAGFPSASAGARHLQGRS